MQIYKVGGAVRDLVAALYSGQREGIELVQKRVHAKVTRSTFGPTASWASLAW